jgi:TonB-linked SusC/RagA family outer membrane protein
MNRKSKWIACSFAFICMMYSGLNTQAQKTISGRVISSNDKQPVASVTVTVKGSPVSTSTSSSGDFSIVVPAGKKELVFTSIGYEPVEVNISNKETLVITLWERSVVLNDMVVTGYTSQRKKDLTGAITVVNVDNMTKQPNSQISNQLQGQASGVTVIGSGQPGEAPQIRIRGINTFGDNSPLYIVDGVSTQNISDVNPEDVGSLQVLKDAGSASIYGSRASNGVIVITTKKGKIGRPVVSLDAYYGVQVPKSGNIYNILNPQEMAQLKYNANANSGTPITSDPLYGNGTTPVLPDYIVPAGASENDPSVNPDLYFINPNYTDPNELQDFYHIVKANKSGTDWYHAAFKNAPIMNYNVGISGGTDNARYLISANYFDQQGVLINTYIKRMSLRANTSYNVSKNLVFGENLAYTITENPKIQPLQAYSAVAFTYRSQPIIPVYDIKGNYGGGYGGTGLGDSPNPVAVQNRTANDKGLDNRLIGNFYMDASFLQNFTFHTSFGGESFAGYYHNFTYPTYENQENTTSNYYSEGSNYGNSWTWTNTLTYHKIFNDIHNFQLLVGTEAFQANDETVGGTTYDYLSFDPNYTTLSSGSGVQTNFSSRSSESLQSLFARLDYSFKDKYLLSATIRRDGSSKFKTYQYGVFPAVSAGWRISQESFMNNVSWVSDLKLRAGWGIMGNQINLGADNAYFTYTQNRNSSFYDITGSNNSIQQGFQVGQIGNPDAKWEKDANTDIGIDATLFKGLLSITFDWYEKDITDLLFNPTLPGTYGNGTVPYQNIANMTNTGIDFTISANKQITKDCKLTGTFSFTTNRNNITKVTDNVDFFYTNDTRDFGTSFIKNQVGHPVGSFYGYKITGFWNTADQIANADAAAQKATGDPAAIYQTDEGIGRYQYQDVNGDGQISDADRTFLGNPNPNFNYGLDLGVTYKNFDFSVFFYGVSGNQIWNQVKWWTDFFPSFSGAKSKTALYDSWTPDHMNAKVPLQELNGYSSSNAQPNSYYVESGSYFRCKNMMIGYTFGGTVLQKMHISNFRLYVQAANLFTVTKYTGYDPEINSQNAQGVSAVTDYGIDEGAYPSTQQWLIGLNVKF